MGKANWRCFCRLGGGGICTDGFGNVLATGHFGGQVDFDPGPGTYNLTSSSTRSIFTLKLRNNGDFAWARMTGGPVGLFEGRAIATDSAGSLYTTALAPGCDMDPDTGTYFVGGDVTVQKLDSTGKFVWAAGWQGDIPGWIGLDYSNNVYITGSFSGANKDFDPGSGTFLLSGGTNSGFIEKLSQSPLDNIEDDLSRQGEIKAYPNPSPGIVFFKSPVHIDYLAITDMTGKTVYASEPNKTETSADLSNKSSGVYFYIIISGNEQIRGKLILQKE